MDQEKYKSAYSVSKRLAEKSIGNAYSFYLHGMVSLKLQKFKEARETLVKAEAFDCRRWRGSNIFNNIIRCHMPKETIYRLLTLTSL